MLGHFARNSPVALSSASLPLFVDFKFESIESLIGLRLLDSESFTSRTREGAFFAVKSASAIFVNSVSFVVHIIILEVAIVIRLPIFVFDEVRKLSPRSLASGSLDDRFGFFAQFFL